MINKIKNNIFQFVFTEFGSCIYLLKIRNKNIIIDTGSKENKSELILFLKELEIKTEEVDFVLITHNHWDHIENIDLFKKAKVYFPEEISDKISEIPEIKVIKAPGHTENDMCFLFEDVLFSGDVIFHHGGIGRTDFPESSPEKMREENRQEEE